MDMPGKAPQQERSMCTTQALEQHSLNWHAVWSWPEWSSTNFAPSVFGSYNNLDFGRCVVPAWMHLEREQFTLYSAGLDGPDRCVVVARFAALGTALWLFLLHRIPLGEPPSPAHPRSARAPPATGVVSSSDVCHPARADVVHSSPRGSFS